MYDLWTGHIAAFLSECQFERWAIIVPEDVLKRWQRRMSATYDELPNEEKEIARQEADRILRALEVRGE